LLLALGVIVLATSFSEVRREATDSRRLVLVGAFLLISIIFLGPGYGPQYITWFLPLLVLTARSFDATWRRILMMWGFVAIVTYLAEYLFLEPYGALLFHLPGRQTPTWAFELATPRNLTLLRLPLFL